MRNILLALLSLFALLALGSNTCGEDDAEQADTEKVQQQQRQCSLGQPIPTFDWSLERHLVTELYKIRNKKVATHSVWRSDTGVIEGDCPSYGYGIPYDTSLTNPQMVAGDYRSRTTIGQAEPNCLFQSQNTQATWVMCLSSAGGLEPMYVESKVTVYSGPVDVDYERNRVFRKGSPTVLIKKE